jgi:glutamyl-tRNA reductase
VAGVREEQPGAASAPGQPRRFADELALRVEATRRAEVERTLRRLRHLADSDKQHIDELSRQIVEAVIGRPLDRLARDGRHMDALRELFRPTA